MEWTITYISGSLRGVRLRMVDVHYLTRRYRLLFPVPVPAVLLSAILDIQQNLEDSE